jgi:hypothetical protein
VFPNIRISLPHPEIELDTHFPLINAFLYNEAHLGVLDSSLPSNNRGMQEHHIRKYRWIDDTLKIVSLKNNL